MKLFPMENPYPVHSTSYSNPAILTTNNSNPAVIETELQHVGVSNLKMADSAIGNDSPISQRSKDHLTAVRTSTTPSLGSESPRSIRGYHKGNGGLQGGGVQEIFGNAKPVSIKKYKSKLDARLGYCLFFCFLSIAAILCIYGAMHSTIHDELTVYVNRTHQIARELKTAWDENYPTNESMTMLDKNGRKYMTVEELRDDAELIEETYSTIWCLFWWNVLFVVVLAIVIVLIHCEILEGTFAKLGYRIVMLICLIFCVAQLLYLIHPLLWGAVKFPNMMNRLFLESYPRDEYQLNSIKDRFACEWEPHGLLVQYDIQEPCLPKLKNSLLPSYTVVLLIILDLLPFAYALFTYAWDAWIKNSEMAKNTRQRIELNNSRRVQFPRSNVYVPPTRNEKNTATSADIKGYMV